MIFKVMSRHLLNGKVQCGTKNNTCSLYFKSSTPNIIYVPRLVGQLMKFISEIFPALIRSLHWTRFLRINKVRAVRKTVISLKPQGMNKGMQKLSRSIIVSTPVYESAYPLSPLFHPMMSKTSVKFGMNHMIRSLPQSPPLTLINLTSTFANISHGNACFATQANWSRSRVV